MAARDDAGAPALRLQVLHHGQGGGRLAGAAGDDVADHDHRHRQALGFSTPARYSAWRRPSSAP
jgi:protein involved in temperature-dependent protein secretion